ncbi:MAG: hypothetical protein RIR97_545 [Pseudomonadota bacterium]
MILIRRDVCLPLSASFIGGADRDGGCLARAAGRHANPEKTTIGSLYVRDELHSLAEINLSLGRRNPQTLDEMEDDFFDLIITLAPEAHHRALELTRSNAIDVSYWPTPDPTVATGTREQILSAYRDVRDHLRLLIDARLAR